jgi:hypothetical protein
VSAALSFREPIDWRTIAPWEWPYLVDLLVDVLPANVTPERPSDVVLRADAKASAPCECVRCAVVVRLRGGRHVEADPDLADEPRPVLGVGRDGVRKPTDPSRMRFDDDAPRKDPKKRRSRANPDKPPVARVVLTLAPDERTRALRVLGECPVRRAYLDPDHQRREWLSTVWIELENPPADVDTVTDLDERITRAIWRAERRLKVAMRLDDFGASSGPSTSRG